MVHRKSWGRIVTIVILGLAVMCAPASSQQFSTPKNVSNNSDFSFTPQLAVDLGGNIYVVWEDDTNTNSNILFSRSTDGGATFSPPKGVSNSAGFSFNPRVAVDTGGTINVVWQDSPDFFRTSNVFFSRSSDAGNTFSTPMNLSGTSSSAFYSTPQIAVHNAGNISIVWESDTGNLAIWFSGSSDGGATFSAPTMLSTNTGGSIDSQIAVDKNGNINVVWEDDLAGHSDISFSRSADNGATFSPPMNLSNPLGNSLANSNSPRLALDILGNINAVWANINPADLNTDIFFARSSDGGATFSTAQNVSHSSGFSSNPWLTVDAGANINVSWEDNTPGNRDIFFARSTDSGTTFPTPVNLSADSGLSLAAQIAADKNGNINVAWQDHTPGISQIFFSRFSSGAAANHPPVAVVGPDQTVPSTGSGGTSVQLDGSSSSDPDGDVLSFVWMDEAGNVVGTTAVVPLTLSLGTHTFTLKVTDPGGLSSTATTHVTVAAVNHTPVADAVAVQTLECSGQGGTQVILNGSKSSDPDGDALSFIWKNEANNVVGTTAVVQLTLTMGTHTFTLTVTDPGGLRATATTRVTVQDTTAPTLRVMLSPDTLWSPNHKLVQINATVETSDSCDANPAVTLVSITSNEPDNGLGDGDQPNDVQAVGGGPIPFGTDVTSFLLRAERSGMGAGRVYTVNYMVRDAAGNESLASAQVSVGSQTTEASPNRSGRKKQ